ncbi:hypothetical protein [Marinimicrobium locisalis]|uniref:hypothetical protein n=1 Tax=Marinimicrobium locisalis TaxID=546022 RepID=UPI0032218D0C
MISYDPSVQPNKEEWLESTEQERIDLVKNFHELNDESLDEEALTVHSAVHVIVENQLAMGVELLPETVAKLTRQGLPRHEAIHAIGAILAEDIFAIVRGERSEVSPNQYRRKLENITAKRWRKGQY